MGQYNIAYRLFHIGIFVVLIITYGVIQYYVIPEHIEDNKKEMVSKYTNYAFTIAGATLTVGSMITEYIDNRMEAKTLKTPRR
jgi:hypothetical protein